MTDQRELDAILVGFLADGTNELADRVIDAALDEIDHTQQRRAFRLPQRFLMMKTSTRAAGAAALAVVVIGGLIFLVRPGQPSVAGPSATPGLTSRPSDASSPTPGTSSPTPGPSPSVRAARQPAWTAAGTMTTNRFLETATLLPNGKVLVVGGIPTRTRVGSLASAELYDPASGSSTPTGTMSTPREAHTATLLPDGRVLVVGGYDDWAALDTAELYDPASGTWTPAGKMTEGHGYHTATLLPDGKVLVAGGRSNNSSTGHALLSAELYDPASGTWSATADLIRAHTFHSATLLPSGKVLIAGASYKGYGLASNATAELYDPSSGSWTATGEMEKAGEYQSAVLLPDGAVLVAGGLDVAQEGCCGSFTNGPQVRVELYDPNTGSWTGIAPMPIARAWHTATLLADGTVLVAGGTGGDSSVGGGTSTYSPAAGLASSEIYDPATGSWIRGPTMSAPRMLHAATLLPDGRVLVFGGGSKQTALDSIEIYDPGSGSR